MFMICSRMTEPAEAFDETASSDAEDWARPMLERQLALLGRLAEAGLEIAVALERQVKSGEPFDGQAVARAYARVSRAVRLTVMLQSKLIGQLQQPKTLADTIASAMDAELRSLEQAGKTRLVGIVARVARAEHDEPDAVERLVAEAAERLDRDDLYGDVLTRPISEIVADICRDLGLEPDWASLAQEAWAQEAVADGEAGAPLEAWMARQARPPPRAGEDANVVIPRLVLGPQPLQAFSRPAGIDRRCVGDLRCWVAGTSPAMTNGV